MKRSLLLLLPCLFLILASCGGSPQGVNSFSMSAKSFEGTAKQIILKRAAGYLVVRPTTGGWYYNSVRPNTGDERERGTVTCECRLYYSASDPDYYDEDSSMIAQAEYQDNADGTCTLTISGNSNSNSLSTVANVAYFTLGLQNVVAEANESLHAYITLIFTGEDAGSWNSNGSYRNTAGGISGADATFGIISK